MFPSSSIASTTEEAWYFLHIFRFTEFLTAGLTIVGAVIFLGLILYVLKGSHG